MAVALDSTTLGGDSVASFNHTCTGSNLVLLVWVYSRNSNVTAISYNSVGMSLLTSLVDGGGGGTLYLYGLQNPSTGTNSVSITGGGSFDSISTSYTGTALPVDSTGTATAASGASKAVTNTVVAANCWLVAGSGAFNTNSNSTSDRTTRQQGQFFSTSYAIAVADSNGTVGTGSQTTTFSNAGSIAGWALIQVALSVFVPSSFTARKQLMGIG